MSDVQGRIDGYKEQAVDKLMMYFAILGFLIYPFSISRVLSVGWQHSFTIHTLALPLILTLFLFKDKFTYMQKAGFYVGLGLLISGVGMYEFGLMGSGAMVGLFSVLIALFYLDVKLAAIALLIAILSYSISAYAFIWGGRAVEIGGLSSIAFWGTTLFTGVIGSAMFGITTFVMQKQLTSLLIESDKTNKIIESQKQKIENLINHDSLTGLLSLRAADDYLHQVLELANQEGHDTALLFVDLDGFKMVNDTYGHSAGDWILKVVAQRITLTIRSIDMACRVGGDEFLIIIREVEKVSDIEHLCARLVQAISERVEYRGTELVIGASIGAAVSPWYQNDAPSLREKADRLMYQVKKTGKNNFLIGAC